MLNRDNNQRDFNSPLLEELVQDHIYLRLLDLVDFASVANAFTDCFSGDKGSYGYPLESCIKMLILQQAENISDRRMERYLRYDLGAKYFCGFNLTEATPDHSYFGKLRKRIGTEKIADLFNSVTKQLEKKGIVSNVFSFIDSTAIISKVSLWEEYDKAHEKEAPSSLHNGNVFKYAVDKDARIGCKGKNKFWFGYKRHQRVDMKSGIITKIKITPANQTDAKAGIDILPEQGMVVADKGYDTNDFHEAARSKNLHNGVIKKNNRKDKHRDKDRWISSIRMPFEGLFSKASKRTPYIGIEKVEFHQTLDALVQNFKRLMKIDCPIKIT
jgi:transposase, IS5 family